MSDPETSPIVSDTRIAGEQQLRRLASLDWSRSGLPAFDEWDEAILAVVRLVACSAGPMALVLGPDAVLLANHAAEKVLAGESGDVSGRPVLEVRPEVAPFYNDVVRQAMNGSAVSLPQQVLRVGPKGRDQTRWFNLEFTPVYDKVGSCFGVLGVASDVTRLMDRIRDLTESEQRLRVALDGSGMVGIWDLDVATGIGSSDANVARIYGLPDKVVLHGAGDDRFYRVIHPDDRERVRAARTEAIEKGVPYRSRYRVVAEDGAVRWLVTSGNPVRDEDGNVVRLLGVVVDVTQQMETANALEASRFQFQTLTETLPQIVWSCDAAGVHDYFSLRWSEFTGIEQQDITEDTWKFLVYPEHQDMVASVWQRALETGEPYDLDYRFRHHSGEYRWLRVMALPIRDDEGRITRWFGTSTDVHESYVMAEERERLALEFERIATEDQLTGVLTRRAFFDRVKRALAPGLGEPADASVLMLDIDHFKSINDNYGHPVGDRVLAQTARRVIEATRSHDLVGRMGGEEFAVFLPNCGEDQAVRIAERIRTSIEADPVSLDDDRQIQLTVSVGATCRPAAGACLTDMLSVADKALYLAKTSGRNRTRFATA